MSLPNLVVSDGVGNILEVPELSLAGMDFIRPVAPDPECLIPLPAITQLVVLPGRIAMGYDAEVNRFPQLREYQGHPVYPVGAVLPADYLQLLRPAYSTLLDAPRLRFDAYVPVGRRDGTFFTTAAALDDAVSTGSAAQPLTSRNSGAGDLVDRAVSALEQDPDTALRLDPATERLAELIARIRERSEAGQLVVTMPHPLPLAARELFHSGLDVVQVAVNSAQPAYFDPFHRGSGQGFAALEEVMDIARDSGGAVWIDYQVFPGLTDHPGEIEALRGLLEHPAVRRCMVSSLAVDPDWYLDELRLFTLSREQVGIRQWMATMKDFVPALSV